jgi:pimeloyl-ACP methyl ester carboxylesterase
MITPASLLFVMLATSSTVIKKTSKRSISTMLARSKEVIISCTDGVQIAAKHMSPPSPDDSNDERILFLHGWLDNAATFDVIAPRVNSILNREVLALDFPGHGHSSHKSMDGPTQLISEYAYYVSEVLTKMDWISDEASETKPPITIVGHSMGAAVTLIYAAAFPEQVSRIILLEGAGPLARNPNDISRHVRSSISRRMKSNKTLFPQDAEGSTAKFQGRKKIYESLTAAIAARKKTAELVPGNQWISTEAAEGIVRRAAIPANEFALHDTTKGGGKELPSEYEGPVVFRHDARLTWPSLQYFSKDQVQALYRDVQCPTCLILADDGWPEEDSDDAINNLLQPKMIKKLPGSHHFHMDPDTADAVSEAVIDFLRNH